MSIYLIFYEPHLRWAGSFQLCGVTLSTKKADAHCKKLNDELGRLVKQSERPRFYVKELKVGLFNKPAEFIELYHWEE